MASKELEEYRQKQERFKKYERHHVNRGSKYPPMTIEPFANERQRLAGMTAEDRLLRKQWLQDQHLSPNEPRFIPEVKPKNFFRRLYMRPTDAVFKSMLSFLGPDRTSVYRWFFPKLFLGGIVTYYCYYHLKYSPQTWERTSGWNVQRTRERCFDVNNPKTQKPEEKEPWEYYDRGFSQRNALQDLKTSYPD